MLKSNVTIIIINKQPKFTQHTEKKPFTSNIILKIGFFFTVKIFIVLKKILKNYHTIVHSNRVDF